ncbi:MAG: antitoxin, partial [Roseibium sp.]
MANPPKVKDPAEAALSAVEEALKLDFGGPEASSETGDSAPRASASDRATSTRPAPSQGAEAKPNREESTPNRRRGRGGRPPAANDDRRNIGGLIFSLQRRPSSAPFWGALVLSVVWGLVGTSLTLSSFGDQLSGITDLNTLSNSPALILAAVAILVPIAFFWVMAMMIWRAQEMRIVARGMTEVALRLAEPEDMAKESILSVGQAIRREVSAMGDGIERAIARASELEVLVHNEVSSLERSYNDNELKIRSLIEELVSQRESIVMNADRVRETISGAHESFAAQLTNTSSEFGSSVDSATERMVEAVNSRVSELTSTVDNRIETLSSSLSSSGNELVEALTVRADDYVVRLTTTGNELVDNLSKSGTDMWETLSARGNEVNERFEATANSFVETLSARGTEINETLSNSSNTVVDTLNQKAEEFRTSLETTGATVGDTISQRGEEINANLSLTSGRLIDTVTARTEEL